MGFAVPAAIGAALARPERPVLCFVGDGGLAMTVAELETLARLRLPVTVVVFDDAALTLIEIKQKVGQGGPSARAVQGGSTTPPSPGRWVWTPSRSPPQQKPERHWRVGGTDPRLIDARIDPATYSELMRVTRG